jgi:hypothetical protein
MQAHAPDSHGHAPAAHDAHGHAAPGHAASAQGARDPSFGAWLGATLLLLAGLLFTFAWPARHSAGDPPGHDAPAHEPAAAPDARTEQQRIAEVFGIMAGHGFADDSVPPEVTLEVEHMIRHVAESDATFTIALHEKTAGETALWLTDRWQRMRGEVYSGEAFLIRALGRKLIDDKVHRIRFADGTDRPLRAWMQEKLDAFRKAGWK